MKNVNKIIVDDIKVEEIVDRLVSEGQEEIIGAEENQLTFDLESDSEELVNFLLQDMNSDELTGQEDAFIAGQESSIAQSFLTPDEDGSIGSPIETDSSESVVDALSGSTLGGGGLSHLSAAPFTNPLSNQALEGETTAASTVSGIQGISSNDGSATIDGLSGISFENRDFGFDAPPPVEIAQIDNILAQEVAPPVEEICNAEDDFYTVEETEGFGIEINYSDILSNDDPGLSIVSVDGFSVGSGSFTPTNSSFSFSSVNLGATSMFINGYSPESEGGGGEVTLTYLTSGGCSAEITLEVIGYYGPE